MPDLTALLDAFALAAPRFASLDLPSTANVADDLLHWAIQRGHGATTRELERTGLRWKCVTVTLPNRASVSAHRPGERVAPVEQQSAEVIHG